MTIFQSLAGMCLVAIALWLIFFFPYRYNEYFKETYGHKAWSSGVAVLQAICTIYAMFSNDGQGNSIVWMIVLIVYILCLTQCYRIAITHGASKTDALKASFSQLFAPFLVTAIVTGFVIAVKNVMGFFEKNTD
jgi:hypothetical protein